MWKLWKAVSVGGKLGLLKVGPLGIIAVVIAVSLVWLGLKLTKSEVLQSLANLLMILFSGALLVIGGIGLIVNLEPAIFSSQPVDPVPVTISGIMVFAGALLAWLVYSSVQAKKAAAERERLERERAEQERQAEVARRASAREARVAQVAQLAGGLAQAGPSAVKSVARGARDKLGALVRGFRQS